MGRIMVAAVLAVSAVCWVGCGGGDNPGDNGGSNTGGNNTGGGSSGSYDYVELGGLKWMKKNLNVSTDSSWCYGEGGQAYDPVTEKDRTLSSSEIQANCNKYGRLYTWEAAKKACQLVGWRLPTQDDWDALGEAVGGTIGYASDSCHTWHNAGKALQSTTGWNYDGNGTDTYGFSALPSGGRGPGGSFFGVGNFAYWWTATKFGSGSAYFRGIYYRFDDLGENHNPLDLGFSARCVKD